MQNIFKMVFPTSLSEMMVLPLILEHNYELIVMQREKSLHEPLGE